MGGAVPILPGGSARRLAAPATILGIAGLAACMTSELGIAYSEAAHRPFLAMGSASITGEGFIRRPNGFLARCSGGEVQLAPQSDYFRQWVALLRSGQRIAERERLAAAHRPALRTTQCDATGRFAFADLPAGKWFVSTRMSYAAERDSFSTDGLYIAEIETRAGEVARVIVSNPNRVQ